MTTDAMEPPYEPSKTLADSAELLRAYLDVYRDTVLRKLDGLQDHQLRASRLPSGWSPLGLLKHLAYMERRWLVWGFAGEQVDAPWGDSASHGVGWQLGDDESLADIQAMLAGQRARTDEIVSTARLSDRARPGGRFATEQDCPTLAWTLFHVLQEYARHAGHLDVARELIDGATGE